MRFRSSSCLRNSSWLSPPKVCVFKLSTCSNISRSSSSRISSRLRPAITHAALKDHGLVVLLVYQACGFMKSAPLTNPTAFLLHCQGKDSHTAFYGCSRTKDDSCVCKRTRSDHSDRDGSGSCCVVDVTRDYTTY